jgi:hypothetical protein
LVLRSVHAFVGKARREDSEIDVQSRTIPRQESHQPYRAEQPV